MKEKLYSFRWVGGGYNVVWAKTKREAVKKAKELGAHVPCILVPREDTFTTKRLTLAALDKAYEGCMN